MKNVRRRRFRKTRTKKVWLYSIGVWFISRSQMIESPEVEKEVKRLLRADTFAVNVCIL